MFTLVTYLTSLTGSDRQQLPVKIGDRHQSRMEKWVIGIGPKQQYLSAFFPLRPAFVLIPQQKLEKKNIPLI